MKLRVYLITGIVAFVLALLIHAPAALVFKLLQSPEMTALPYGLQGTLGRGQVAGIGVQNQTTLRQLRWELKPLSLLLGRIRFDLQSQDAALLEGRLSFGLFGGSRIDDLRYAGPLKPLLAAAGQAYAPMDGEINLHLDTLRIKQGRPQRVEGTLRLSGLAWTLARDPLVLGDFQALLSSEDGTLNAQLESLSGPIELKGEARLLPDQSHEYEIRMRPKPDAPPMLRNLLSSAGPLDAQGWHLLRGKGAAKP